MKIRSKLNLGGKTLGKRPLDSAQKLQTPSRGWMMTSTDAQNQAIAVQQLRSGHNRPPEFWLKDGEERPVRFRSSQPIAMLWRYSLRVNGNWASYTAPAEGEEDLFRDELGLRPALKAIYELIDIKGYTDKKGKKFKNVPRFYATNTRTHQQLQKFNAKRGPITKYDIEISRTGTGTQTLYSMMPGEISPMSYEAKTAPSLAADFAKYYAPLTEAEQRALIKQRTSRDTEDSD